MLFLIPGRSLVLYSMTSKEYAPVETDAMDVEKEPYHPPMETPEYPVEQPTAPKPAPPGAVHKTSISRKLKKSGHGRYNGL